MMRRKHLRVLGSTLVPLCLGFIGWGQPLCDLEIPESTIKIAGLSFAYRHYDGGRTPEVDASNGWLAGRLERLVDSPDLGYTMWATTQLDLDTWVATSWLASESMPYRDDFAERLPLFAYAGVRIDAATYFLHSGCETRAGIGIGRSRNVTPLVQTLRIHNELERLGTVKRPLSNRDSLNIAERIARAGSYGDFEDHVEDVAESDCRGHVGGGVADLALRVAPSWEVGSSERSGP